MTTSDPSQPTTQPQDADRASTARVTVVEAFVRDPETKALFVHRDLEQVSLPWAVEEHLSPIKADERFGDVDSWAAYIKRHAKPESPPFIAWTARGLHAVLDYHNGTTGRCQWTAMYPFVLAPAFDGWLKLADNRARSQRDVVEWLESHVPDIVEPGDLITSLRTLRTTVNKTSTVEVREDGTSSVQFAGDNRAAGRGGPVELPPEFKIAVQVLKGHVEPALDDSGVQRRDERGQPIFKPVLYRLAVHMRVIVGDDSKATFRFEIPLAERTLEDVYTDRVRAAQQLLGTDFEVLRGAERG